MVGYQLVDGVSDAVRHPGGYTKSKADNHEVQAPLTVGGRPRVWVLAKSTGLTHRNGHHPNRNVVRDDGPEDGRDHI